MPVQIVYHWLKKVCTNCAPKVENICTNRVPKGKRNLRIANPLWARKIKRFNICAPKIKIKLENFTWYVFHQFFVSNLHVKKKIKEKRYFVNCTELVLQYPFLWSSSNHEPILHYRFICCLLINFSFFLGCAIHSLDITRCFAIYNTLNVE